jgi:serine/threonine protein kinase
LIDFKSVSHYDIIDRIGEGQLGEVYLASDNEHSRQVALRVLHPVIANDTEKVLRIKTAVANAAALNHSSVTSVYGLFADSGSTFLATEYVSGQGIETKCIGKPVSLREAVDWGLQIAEALTEANDRSIIHGGVKPSNVLVTSSGQLKLLDFGFPPDLHDRASDTDLNLNDMLYQSPERLSQKMVEHRTDIYAAGILLYELITGRRPFMAPSPHELRDMVMRRQPSPMYRHDVDLPTELLRTVGRCLQKDPVRRYEMASDLAADLTNIRATLQFF